MIVEKINIIIPPVWSGVYLNIARLLKYSLEDLKIETAIVEAGQRQAAGLSILLGWNLMPDEIILNSPYIIYQLEPLILPLWRDKIVQKRNLFQKALSLWDYSEANVDYLKQFGFNPEIVPLGYHSKLTDVSFDEFPDYDVLFVGFLTDRRKIIIEELQQYCYVSMQPRWGKDFSEALGRSKIILNIHQYDALTPLEQPRISYALNNRCFIISETSIDNPYLHLKTCHYKKIISTTLYFLHNEKERNEKKNICFASFASNKMEIILSEKLSRLLCEIGNPVVDPQA